MLKLLSSTIGKPVSAGVLLLIATIFVFTGCSKPDNPPATPPAAQSSESPQGTSVPQSESPSGGDRDQNSRPLNPEKFG